jgi:cytidine deaminase
MRKLRGGYDDHRLGARCAHSGEGSFVFACAVNIEFHELDLCLCSNRTQLGSFATRRKFAAAWVCVKD